MLDYNHHNMVIEMKQEIETKYCDLTSLDQRLQRLKQLFPPIEKKPTIFIKGKGQRILVSDLDDQQDYTVPYWFSERGNICWKINQTVFFKTKAGYVGKKEGEGKWTRANWTTKAKALEETA